MMALRRRVDTTLGGHVLVTDNLELGIRVGWGLNDTSPDFFSNVGVGWRY